MPLGVEPSQQISIHALREEGDPSRQSSCCWCSSYFYPRPPRGGRHLPGPDGTFAYDFYPRPPRGGRPRSSLM